MDGSRKTIRIEAYVKLDGLANFHFCFSTQHMVFGSELSHLLDNSTALWTFLAEQASPRQDDR